MKIKFESNDDLPLGNILNIPMCTIIVRSVLKKMVDIIHKLCYMNVCMNVNMNILNRSFV